jgi:bisanhydrobacterioruberin hydratase
MNPKPFLYLLTAMYIAGFIGLQMPQVSQIFRFLTPFNLIFSLGILLYFHKEWNRNFLIFSILAFSVGFFVEVIGVYTGVVFGKYHYEKLLGFKIFGVPPVIGCNWLLLIYCVGSFHSKFNQPIYQKVFSGAVLLTMLDFLIEPVAIKLGMWTWETEQIPIQNYIAWFFVSALLLTVFHGLKFRKDNPISLWLFILQILFFGLLRIGFS